MARSLRTRRWGRRAAAIATRTGSPAPTRRTPPPEYLRSRSPVHPPHFTCPCLQVLQFQGDQRDAVMSFLVDNSICEKGKIKKHGHG
mmetsp:Transcript_9328/g.20413  ORF Transcript_9328/g.20413 Transcript_9328/m.20413 type:complete len:87 (-) Transcript_9328:605-865(-)